MAWHSVRRRSKKYCLNCAKTFDGKIMCLKNVPHLIFCWVKSAWVEIDSVCPDFQRKVGERE